MRGVQSRVGIDQGGGQEDPSERPTRPLPPDEMGPVEKPNASDGGTLQRR
jgi:hypothetical protein